MNPRSNNPHAPLFQQRGIALFVALIALVVMSLAAASLVRSVDTANIVAGNRAFKQSALGATDRGVQAALDKFDTAIVSSPLSTESATASDSATNCYKSSAFKPTEIDSRGVPSTLLFANTTTFDTSYPNCKITLSSTGEVIRYIVDRQCDVSRAGLAADNTHCNVVSSSTPARTDNDLHTGSESVPLFRVTVRVDGPRKTMSFAQVIFRP